MNKNIKAAVYMRVATFEQVDDRTSQMKEFADKNGYEISDFIVEQRSSLAACSKTLYGLLHNQYTLRRGQSAVPLILLRTL